MIFEKIRKSFKDAVSEHYISVIVFLIATVVWAVEIDTSISFRTDEILVIIYKTLMGTALGVLLCEAIHLYKGKEINNKRKLLYCVITLISFTATLWNCLVQESSALRVALGDDFKNVSEISANVLICLLISGLSLTIFFFYKRSGESFETYTAKAFCGLMKAELVYGIIAIGVLLILFAFETLIYDFGNYVIGRVEIVLLGLVEFPCALIGLSKTEGKISKFGRIVLNYVFTGLLLAAFVIIYVYILKILITWKFPGNEVFSILTALFGFGILIWTMAQGVCADNLKKPLLILPFLFVPFIVLQIMCLYMRVKDYGFTFSRYMGLFVILFEIVYFGIYTFGFISKKEIMSSVLFVAIASSFIVLLVPGINVYSVVTASQKAKIIRYLEAGENSTFNQKRDAGEAYKAIRDEGGIVGDKYLKRTLTEAQIEEISDGKSIDSGSERIYINVRKDRDTVDVAGYDSIMLIDTTESEFDDGLEFDTTKIELVTRYDETVVGTIDVKDLIELFYDNQKRGLDHSVSQKELETPIITNEGDTFIMTYFYIFGYDNGTLDLRSIEIEGYLLK